MIVKLGGSQGWLGSFLVAYFVLLFCFGVSIVQSGVWLFVGLTSLVCCCIAFFGWFTRFNYRYHRKFFKDVSIDKMALSGRRSQSR
jgi:protein-S-isoprenylcysteine O-methyltransferase Ste14